ncbi:MAG: phenylalanyl-tRNA synthetase alpha chain [Candidatus Woesearchaeota archaeon]|nr:phenylalanyl-tRNA synthetase alpha chain [Candidatus Woesearchaeota archaeon]
MLKNKKLKSYENNKEEERIKMTKTNQENKDKRVSGNHKNEISDKIILKLNPIERRVISCIKDKEDNFMTGIVEETGLQEVEVMRAIQWLGNKGLIRSEKIEEERISLGRNGLEVLKKGLPEKRLLLGLSKSYIELKEIQKYPERFNLNREELNFALGSLKKIGAIEIRDNIIRITQEGKETLKNGFEEEDVLKKIKDGEMPSSNLIKELTRRKDFIKIDKIKDWKINLTEAGVDAKKNLGKEEILERLSPEMLLDGSWRGKKFRHYDIEAPVPKLNPGRRNFITEVIEYVKRIWIELGFKEINGNIIQSAFWDLDVLFVPQDHPAREMQDTFYIEGKGELPEELFKKISDIHNDGGNSKSRGWGAPLNKEESERLLLRTHSTVLSAITLSKLKKEDIPGKYFSISKVFRNETLDWKHLFEFYQVEGIVVSEDVDFSALKGLLKLFYKKMGYDEIRLKPAYFPYTEPSVEVEVYSEDRKEWIELGGAGIFRPEVTLPLLGKEIPVLAWGLGLERIMMNYFGFTDLRDIYKNDLDVLRRIKRFVKI